MVSSHRLVHSRIMLTCYPTCQTDRCTAGENTKMAFSLVCTYCSRNMPEQVPYQNMATCTVDCTTTCMGMSVVRLRSMKSSLPSTSLMDELLQTLSNNLPYCKQQKTRRGLGTRPYSYTPMKPLNSQMTTFIANNKGQGANLFVNNQTL